jgi:hypothetical protein
MHREVHLGRQDDVIAAAVLLDRSTDDLLRAANPVDVGGVPQSDAQLEGLLEEQLSLLVAQRPFAEPARRVAKAHAPESNPADHKTGVT